MEPQGEVRAVRTLHREVGDQRGRILRDGDVLRSEEVDDDVDIGTAVAGGHGAYELKAPQTLPLSVALLQERFDELRIFAIAQRLRVQGKIDIQSADVRHVRLVEQQPGDGAADDGKLSPVVPQDLPDLHQNRSDGNRRAVVVVGGAARVYLSHGKHSPARCSAASRSRSRPVQRSR